MSPSHLVIFLLVGALAGWCAGLVSKGSGFGLIGNIIVGVIGAFIGEFAFGLLGIVAYSFVGRFLFALIGALVFIRLLGFIKK
jgi:uncharacterized membrane protein YeaQ/YmgE (transglycosylase-associated protein family)